MFYRILTQRSLAKWRRADAERGTVRRKGNVAKGCHRGHKLHSGHRWRGPRGTERLAEKLSSAAGGAGPRPTLGFCRDQKARRREHCAGAAGGEDLRGMVSVGLLN